MSSRIELCLQQTLTDLLSDLHPEGDEWYTARRNGVRVLLLAKWLPAPRIEDLFGRLAVGELEITARKRRDAIYGIPMAVVVATPKAGRNLLAAAEEFVQQHLQGMDWGIVDERGARRLEMRHLGVHETRTPARGATPLKTTERRSVKLFSDLNRWMLKCLFLAHTGQLPCSADRPTRTATELHQAATVPPPSAYRFLAALEAAEFLYRSDAEFGLQRIPELMVSWVADEMLNPPTVVGWSRAQTPGVPPLKGRWAISEAPPDLRPAPVGQPRFVAHLEDPQSAVLPSDFSTEPLPDASVLFVQPRYPRSIFLASQDSRVDPLQAILDRLHLPGSDPHELTSWLTTTALRLFQGRL